MYKIIYLIAMKKLRAIEDGSTNRIIADASARHFAVLFMSSFLLRAGNLSVWGFAGFLSWVTRVIILKRTLSFSIRNSD